MIIERMKQGSKEWDAGRCGRVTMSNAQKLTTGGKGVTRHNYLLDVASEILTGVPVEGVTTWEMERGSLLEPYALDAYRTVTGAEVETIGLAYLDESKRISASPDGLMLNARGGAEVKCPSPKIHMQHTQGAETMKKHMAQIQGNIWVFGAEWWDFISFCPEFTAMPLVIYRVQRDDDLIEKIEHASHSAVAEIDGIVDELRGKAAQMDVIGDIVKAAKMVLAAVSASDDDFHLDSE